MKRIRSKQPRKRDDFVFPIISLWEFSRAAKSVVGGPIWLKFELIQDIMHVLITKNSRKNVMT